MRTVLMPYSSYVPAFVVYAAPASENATEVAMLGGKGTADVWPLKSANNLEQAA